MPPPKEADQTPASETEKPSVVKAAQTAIAQELGLTPVEQTALEIGAKQAAQAALDQANNTDTQDQASDPPVS